MSREFQLNGQWSVPLHQNVSSFHWEHCYLIYRSHLLAPTANYSLKRRIYLWILGFFRFTIELMGTLLPSSWQWYFQNSRKASFLGLKDNHGYEDRTEQTRTLSLPHPWCHHVHAFVRVVWWMKCRFFMWRLAKRIMAGFRLKALSAATEPERPTV